MTTKQLFWSLNINSTYFPVQMQGHPLQDMLQPIGREQATFGMPGLCGHSGYSQLQKAVQKQKQEEKWQQR